MFRPLLPFLLLVLAPLAMAAPEKWAAAIDKFTQHDVAVPPPREAILFIGSSSIVMWSSLTRDFPHHTVINRGFSGSELFDSAHYADRIAIPYAPRQIVVYAGENDLQNGKSPEDVHASFKTFVSRVHAALPKTRIAFISIKPSPSRAKIAAQVVAANALIAATCKADPRLAYIDIHTPMLDTQGKPRPELFLKDMLHLNETGYALWRPIVAAHLK